MSPKTSKRKHSTNSNSPVFKYAKGVSLEHCYLVKLMCRHAEDLRTIHQLTAVAMSQSHMFTLQPWNSFTGDRCAPNAVCYVFWKKGGLDRSYNIRAPQRDMRQILAQTLETHPETVTICGWMTVYQDMFKIPRGPRGTRWYLGEIASANATKKTFGGIGEALLRALYSDALRSYVDYIYFISLGSARSYYQAWRRLENGEIALSKKNSPILGAPPLFTEVTLGDSPAVYMYAPVTSAPPKAHIDEWKQEAIAQGENYVIDDEEIEERLSDFLSILSPKDRFDTSALMQRLTPERRVDLYYVLEEYEAKKSIVKDDRFKRDIAKFMIESIRK